MLRKRVLIGCALLGFVVVALGASGSSAVQRGWRGAVAALTATIDDLLGEGDTHLALVRGAVSFTGDPLTAGDFRVDKTGTGKYTVFYTGVPFLAAPTVLVQVTDTPFCAVAPSLTVDCIAYTAAGTLTGFDVETKNLGVLDDASFKFIAIGPR